MLNKPITLLLTAGVALSSALPIDLNRYVETLEQKILNTPIFKSSSPQKQLSSKYGKFSIGSLIPQADYENWITNESDYAFESIIRNIGGYGTGIDDALPGTVVASPSRTHPNYYYQWTRDAAISINNLVLQHADQHAKNSTLWHIITDYVTLMHKIQRLSNPSGTFADMQGLGEPKFEVDGKAFTGNWGRPQRDGPALRAITISNFINTEVKYNSSVSFDTYRDIFNNIVRYDLDYVAAYWHQDGFDLWEEINGKHFYTFMVQHSSLVAGSKIADSMGYRDASSYYATQAEYLAAFIKEKFWNSTKGHLIETYGLDYRSGLDSALFLASLHSLDILNWDGESTATDLFPPYSDEILSSLSQYVESMRNLYPINFVRMSKFTELGFNSSMVGIGVGRYPEDVYNGDGTSVGNPWFLCTSTVSQNLYLLADYLASRPTSFNLAVNKLNKGFYGLFLNGQDGFDWSDPKDYILNRDSDVYNFLIKMVIDYADSFLDVVREHQDSEGNLSEQFNRYDGYMTGARDLTWSYGAFWQAVRQREITLKKFRLA